MERFIEEKKFRIKTEAMVLANFNHILLTLGCGVAMLAESKFGDSSSFNWLVFPGVLNVFPFIFCGRGYDLQTARRISIFNETCTIGLLVILALRRALTPLADEQHAKVSYGLLVAIAVGFVGSTTKLHWLSLRAGLGREQLGNWRGEILEHDRPPGYQFLQTLGTGHLLLAALSALASLGGLLALALAAEGGPPGLADGARRLRGALVADIFIGGFILILLHWAWTSPKEHIVRARFSLNFYAYLFIGVVQIALKSVNLGIAVQNSPVQQDVGEEHFAAWAFLYASSSGFFMALAFGLQALTLANASQGGGLGDLLAFLDDFGFFPNGQNLYYHRAAYPSTFILSGLVMHFSVMFVPVVICYGIYLAKGAEYATLAQLQFADLVVGLSALLLYTATFLCEVLQVTVKKLRIVYFLGFLFYLATFCYRISNMFSLRESSGGDTFDYNTVWVLMLVSNLLYWAITIANFQYFVKMCGTTRIEGRLWGRSLGNVQGYYEASVPKELAQILVDAVGIWPDHYLTIIVSALFFCVESLSERGNTHRALISAFFIDMYRIIIKVDAFYQARIMGNPKPTNHREICPGLHLHVTLDHRRLTGYLFTAGRPAGSFRSIPFAEFVLLFPDAICMFVAAGSSSNQSVKWVTTLIGLFMLCGMGFHGAKQQNNNFDGRLVAKEIECQELYTLQCAMGPDGMVAASAGSGRVAPAAAGAGLGEGGEGAPPPPGGVGAGRLFEVAVPEGVQPGETFTAQVEEGLVATVRCPAGLGEGRRFRFRVGGPGEPPAAAAAELGQALAETLAHRVTVPAGLGPGDQFRRRVGARLMTLTVPPGLRGGDALLVVEAPDPELAEAAAAGGGGGDDGAEAEAEAAQQWMMAARSRRRPDLSVRGALPALEEGAEPRVEVLERTTAWSDAVNTDEIRQFPFGFMARKQIEVPAGMGLLMIKASVSWRDQGWGDQEGRLLVRIHRGREQIFEMDLFGLAGHNQAEVSTEVHPDHPHLSEFLARSPLLQGDVFSIWFKVGAASAEMQATNHMPRSLSVARLRFEAHFLPLGDRQTQQPPGPSSQRGWEGEPAPAGPRPGYYQVRPGATDAFVRESPGAAPREGEGPLPPGTWVTVVEREPRFREEEAYARVTQPRYGYVPADCLEPVAVQASGGRGGAGAAAAPFVARAEEVSPEQVALELAAAEPLGLACPRCGRDPGGGRADAFGAGRPRECRHCRALLSAPQSFTVLGSAGLRLKATPDLGSEEVGHLGTGTLVEVAAPPPRWAAHELVLSGRRVQVVAPLQGWASMFTASGYRLLGQRFRVCEGAAATVRATPDLLSPELGTLGERTLLDVAPVEPQWITHPLVQSGRRVRIVSPLEGYVSRNTANRQRLLELVLGGAEEGAEEGPVLPPASLVLGHEISEDRPTFVRRIGEDGQVAWSRLGEEDEEAGFHHHPSIRARLSQRGSQRAAALASSARGGPPAQARAIQVAEAPAGEPGPWLRRLAAPTGRPELRWLTGAGIEAAPAEVPAQVTPAELAAAARLNFEGKRAWFLGQLARLHVGRAAVPVQVVRLEVRRREVLADTMRAFARLGSEDFRKIFRYNFREEQGTDAGGVGREFWTVATEALFAPERKLWRFSQTDNLTYNIASAAVEDGEEWRKTFQFVGHFLAKAIFDQQVLTVSLTRPLYKHILGVPVSFSDLQFVNKAAHDSLTWMLTNDPEILYMDFTVQGDKGPIELKSGGAEIDLTDQNKHEYIKLYTEHLMFSKSYSDALAELLSGFYQIIPPGLLSVFDFQELELLMCGVPEINVSDWRRHTTYTGNLGANRPVSRWFWEVMESFEMEQRSRLLQFVTGTARVPAGGFKNLQGVDGERRQFTLHGLADVTNRYPVAHTCFNRLDMPNYASKQQVQEALELVIQIDVTGFSMA